MHSQTEETISISKAASISAGINQDVTRLTAEAYRQFENQVQQPMVGDKTTELQAGFQLGIQHCLLKLRNGFTYGT